MPGRESEVVCLIYSQHWLIQALNRDGDILDDYVTEMFALNFHPCFLQSRMLSLQILVSESLLHNPFWSTNMLPASMQTLFSDKSLVCSDAISIHTYRCIVSQCFVGICKAL